jgi:hypothetical protein
MDELETYWQDILKNWSAIYGMLIIDYVRIIHTMESLTLNHVIRTTNWYLTVKVDYWRPKSQFQ